MKIRVILHSYLRERLPPESKGRAVIDLPSGSRVADLFDLLGLPPQAAWSLNNSIQRDLNLELHENDELRVFRQGAGG